MTNQQKMKTAIKLIKPTVDDFPRLLEIWEASVRATHDFVTEEDIQFFKSAIQEHSMFANTSLTCAQTKENMLTGFIGVTGDNLDMLFIAPEYRGMGIGRALLQDAILTSNIKRVEVNEQNDQAVGFYEHFGFRTYSRSELDEMGKPFPLLHMTLE